MSKFKGKKTKNAPTNAKEKIRTSVLDYIQEPSVLELFCGSGVMYSKVWYKCNSYIGVDIEPQNDHRMTVSCDAFEYAKSANIEGINVFDIDAFGSPYKCLLAIIKRLKKANIENRIAFCITDGIEIDMRMSNIQYEMAELAGVSVKKVKNAHLIHDRLIKLIISNIANILDSVVVSAVMSKGNTGAGMRYYSFVIESRKKDSFKNN